MIETLVLLSCLYGQGCAETSQTYYAQNAQLQLQIQRVEERLKYKLGEQLYAVGSSGALFIAGRDFTFQLTTHIALRKTRDVASVAYTYNF